MLSSRTTGGVIAINLLSAGTGYAAAPTVSLSGGGGTGCTAVCHMAGTRVESVVIVNQGTGYTSAPSVTLTAATGSGATAEAKVYAGSLRPMTFFQGRFGDVYGVDGMGRGIRWDNAATTAVPIGVAKPAVAPAVTAGTTVGEYVADITMVGQGGGYTDAPTVTISGGTPSTQASGRAVMSNGRVLGVRLAERGRGYQDTPSVSFSGGIGDSPFLNVGVIGKVAGLTIPNGGQGYTTTPACTGSTDGYVYIPYHGMAAGSTVSFSSLSGGAGIDVDRVYYATSVGSSRFKIATSPGGSAVAVTQELTHGRARIPPPVVIFGSAAGLSGAYARVAIADGEIAGSSVLSGGTGATTSSTAAIVGGAGTNASVQPIMNFRVDSITAATSGEGFYAAPIVTIRPAESDSDGSGAAATASVNDVGQVTGVTVYAGGSYREKPDALVLDTEAKATAKMRSHMEGKYYCAIRYIDDTPLSRRGPIVSSISDITEVDVEQGCGTLEWSFTHVGVDDRVVSMELWRSTADQATALFRVATIAKSDPAWTAGYTDTLSEPELVDRERDGFGVLPVTLPSGQVNARRFGVPPGSLAVGVVFQDRAWYAVDTTGERPNSLYFSEVDEPESVPPVNELVVQQNTGKPDKIVALIPLGPTLLVAQDAHLYSLSYVAQPVIDASINLVGYRGILNDRCWTVMGGVAFIADSFGIYAFDGNREEPVSVAVDNYWRDGIVDMSKSDQFHIGSDYDTKTVRFYYCKPGDSAPVRALCYCVATKAWWEETYPEAVTATCQSLLNNRYQTLTSSNGSFLKASGVVDQDGSPVEYRVRSGNLPLTVGGDEEKSISVIYKPTAEDSNLNLRLHYNNAPSPRPNAISSDRGSGFVTTAGSQASLNMNVARSPLGDASGLATAYYSGRVDPRSAGADRHVAVEMAGTQSGTTGSAVVLTSIQMQGVG